MSRGLVQVIDGMAQALVQLLVSNFLAIPGTRLVRDPGKIRC